MSLEALLLVLLFTLVTGVLTMLAMLLASSGPTTTKVERLPPGADFYEAVDAIDEAPAALSGETRILDAIPLDND